MPINLNKYLYSVIGVTAIVVLSGWVFYFLYPDSGPTDAADEGVETPTDAATSTTSEPQIVVKEPVLNSNEGQQALKPLPSYTGQPLRELNADSKFIASIGEALYDKYQKNIAEIATRLETNPKNYDDWLAVAYIKKLFSNYIGVRDAWEYAKVIDSASPIAYFNLGELYGYEFKELSKAEKNYKTALRLNQYNFDYYVGLANFYEDVLGSPEKAEAVFLSALEKIPHTEVNLFAEIGAFYRDQKNYEKAVEYFERALKAAEATRDPAIKKAVENELDYIRSKQ